MLSEKFDWLKLVFSMSEWNSSCYSKFHNCRECRICLLNFRRVYYIPVHYVLWFNLMKKIHFNKIFPKFFQFDGDWYVARTSSPKKDFQFECQKYRFSYNSGKSSIAVEKLVSNDVLCLIIQFVYALILLNLLKVSFSLSASMTRGK